MRSSRHLGVEVTLTEKQGEPGVWVVEATGAEEGVCRAIFIGAKARERAEEYARFKYEAF